MHLLTSTAGWVQVNDRLLWTNDLGVSWTDVTPSNGLNQAIVGVFFLDVSNGWVLSRVADSTGAHLELATTVNAGQNWDLKSFPSLTSEDLNSLGGTAPIQFVDAFHGWIMLRLTSSSNFSLGRLFVTSDGATSWRELPAPPSGDEFRFTSTTQGWLTNGASRSKLYVTSNGGSSWSAQSLAVSSGLQGATPTYSLPTFQDEHYGVVPVTFTDSRGQTTALYQTSDGGHTWKLGQVTANTPTAEEGPRISVSRQDLNLIQLRINATGTAALEVNDNQSNVAARTASGQISGVTAADFLNRTQGWLVLSAGNCLSFKSDCTQENRLFATSDGGSTLTEITPSVAAPETTLTPDAALTTNASITTTGLGFDKCAAATVGQMQAWWTNTPWLAANIYIGGNNRACSQANLNSSWVTQVFNQGWFLIPTWVGPQAPCTTCSGCATFSSTPATAASQGVTEANNATKAAAALGLTKAVIYYDLERYNPSGTCSAAASAFVNAWTQQMHKNGNVAGVYGSPGNAGSDWASIANPPDAVWIALWNGNKSVFGLSPLSDSLWVNHQRLHQYVGGHNETWGGVTFNIDSDSLDGPSDR